MNLIEIKQFDAKYNRAKQTGMGLKSAKDSLMNVLFNCKDELIGLINVPKVDEFSELKIKALQEQNARLNQQIDEMETQLRKLKSRRQKGGGKNGEQSSD